MPITIRRVPLPLLHPDPGNIRSDLHGIEELAASIRTQGLLQPLLVVDQNGRLIVNDGHRRLKALHLAGRSDALCIITPAADRCTVLSRMIAAANTQRLEPIEQARAFKQMRDLGMSTADVAKATGVSPGLVRERLLLLTLPDSVQQMVSEKELPPTRAAGMARTLRATGSAQSSSRRTSWLNSAHPLAGVARTCPHTSERTVLGGVACGQCWEAAIRADERVALSRGAA